MSTVEHIEFSGLFLFLFCVGSYIGVIFHASHLCLQAGVSKLNEAKALVDELKRRAAEQSALLKTKQQEADSALQEITTSMQVCVLCVCASMCMHVCL